MRAEKNLTPFNGYIAVALLLITLILIVFGFISGNKILAKLFVLGKPIL